MVEIRRNPALAIWWLSAVGGVLSAFAANHHQRSAIQDLALQGASRLDTPVVLGGVALSLSGALRLQDIAVGTFLKIDSVDVDLGRAFFSRRETREARVQIVKPHLTLQWSDFQPHSDLRKWVDIVREQQSESAEARVLNKTRITRSFSVIDGSLSLETQLGHLSASRIQAESKGMRGLVLAEAWSFSSPSPLGNFELHFGPTGIEFDASAMRVERAVATGGNAALEARGERASLIDTLLTYNVDDAGFVLVGETPNQSPFRASLTQEKKGTRIHIDTKNAPTALAGYGWPALFESSGTFDGSLDILAAKETYVSLDARFKDVAVNHPRLSANRVALPPASVRASFTTRLNGSGQRIGLVEDFKVSFGQVDLRGSGSFLKDPDMDWPESIRSSLSLEQVSCASLFRTLPPALRSHLQGIQLRGDFSAALEVSYDRYIGDATINPVIQNGCQVLREPPLADVSELVGRRRQVLRNVNANLDEGEATFTALEDLPDFVSKAFVAAEDGRFYRHPGFDLRQIERSLAVDAEYERFIRGGSTITQQLAKNLYLSHERTFARKFEESVLTWRLETRLTKDQLLEIYLNIIELSDQGDYGITAAARRWFDVSPIKLTLEQAAFLAALTREPTTMGRRVRAYSGLDEKSLRNAELVLRALKRDGVITRLQQKRASAKLPRVLDHLFND